LTSEEGTVTDSTTAPTAAQPAGSAPAGSTRPGGSATPQVKAQSKAQSKAKAAATDASSGKPAVPQRSVAQIQADIAGNQRRLADTVDEISERITPQAIADGAKSKVKGVFVHPDGSPKGKPIAIIGGTIAGLVVLRAIFRD
jgi:hypothetical protein